MSSFIKPLPNSYHLILNSLLFTNVIIHLIPQFRLLSYYPYIWLFTMLLWFTLVLVVRPTFMFKLSIPMIAMLFFSLYTVIIANLFNNYSIGNRYLGISQIVFYYFAFQFNKRAHRSDLNLKIILYLLPAIIYTTLRTINGLRNNAYASRMIKSTGEETVLLLSQDIGGYEFIYFITFLFVFMVIIVLEIKMSSLHKLSILIFSSLLLYSVILSNYMTSIVLILVTINIYLIFRYLSNLKILFNVFLIIILILNAEAILLSILDMAIALFPDGISVSRFQMMQQGLKHNYSIDVYDGRFETLSISISGFINNPIFGNISNVINYDGFVTEFGQHSQILDTFSLFGIIGLVQIYFLIQPFVRNINKHKATRALSLSILIAVLIINMFNNTAPLIGFAFFFVYPTIEGLLKERLCQS
jgi:hypothetical protein